MVIFVAVLHRYGITISISLAQWGRSVGADWLFTAGRAVFNFLRGFNLTWAQELCIYMFVWMAKFGAAYGVRTGIHVGVDVLINRLDDRLRGKFIVFGLLAGALFTGIVATLGAHFVWENGAHYAFFKFFGMEMGDLYEGPITPDLEWPTWIVYGAIPLGSSLMCFRFLQVTWSFLKTGELPHHDHGHVDGLEEEKPPVDFDPYGMDDNLHMRDLKHTMVGENRRVENKPVEEDRRKDDLGGMPK